VATVLESDLFQFTDYKAYLSSVLGGPRGKRGLKTELARAAGCQLAYLSQVLGGNAHLSLEQGEAIARYLGCSARESHGLLLLIQLARAGTPSLRAYFQNQWDGVRQQQLRFKERLPEKPALSAEMSALYFGSWHYSAIHVLLTIDRPWTPQQIAQRLGLAPERVQEALSFLERCGLVVREKGRLRVGLVRMHLDDDSPHISRHHTNWRLRAVDCVERATATSLQKNLHYSSVVSLSREDVTRLRQRLMSEIERAKALVRESPGETLYAFSVDFFGLEKD
jgi:hypothetical protein